ncbi:hypothetical protein K227x_61340 [Rubripirellula lacrimiformis]|uniref:Uncharacterized protein n=1 Tax=Rubripirellula lacrimiformis TaxID=1930273 RepID=A0A517NKQ9_9BACT|nr:hypothetical protein [Rubripirellula lacrimiformis]QDT07706.1 hypothetical protein K227x_61340 [Rubripirellula lacrimiformis]
MATKKTTAATKITATKNASAKKPAATQTTGRKMSQIDAAEKDEAASLGQDALQALYADLRAKHGRDIPIKIRTVRRATDAVIDLWLHPHVERQAGRKPRATTRRDFKARRAEWLYDRWLVGSCSFASGDTIGGTYHCHGGPLAEFSLPMITRSLDRIIQ